MTAEQVEGYALFKEYSCATCHAGVNMGGLSYELMGRRANYFEDRELTLKSGLTDGDNGRNVALTYPYYHDGSVETLNQAISMMAKYQVGRDMPQEDVLKIEKFFDALTGEYQGKLLTNTNMKP